MSEEKESTSKKISIDIEVLLKQGLKIESNADIEVIVYSTNEEEVS